MTMSNMYQIKINERGESYINLGRFHSKSLKRQMESEFQEDLGFCIRAYRNPDNPLPVLMFFRKEDINGNIRGYKNLEKYPVTYVNLFFKKGNWIMKIAPVKGGE